MLYSPSVEKSATAHEKVQTQLHLRKARSSYLEAGRRPQLSSCLSQVTDGRDQEIRELRKMLDSTSDANACGRQELLALLNEYRNVLHWRSNPTLPPIMASALY